MKLSGSTILITGGTSGIGYEFAAQLIKRGNTVIVTGRNQSRLEQTQKSLPGIHTFQNDVSSAKAISSLFDAVVEKFPALNVLINNAGIMRKINLLDRYNLFSTVKLYNSLPTSPGPMESVPKARLVAASVHLALFSITWLLAWLQPQPLADGPAALPFFLLLLADLPFSIIPWGMMWSSHLISALVLWGVAGTAWWYFLGGIIWRPKRKVSQSRVNE